MKIVIIFLLTLIFLNSCNKIKYGDFYVSGSVKIKGKDTIFSGPIIFYDSLNKIVRIATYRDNLLDGEYTEYYNSGIVKQKAYFINDVLNGVDSQFNDKGEILYKRNYFYGLCVGPQVEYKNESVSNYTYVTFSNYPLYHCSRENDSISTYGSLLNYTSNKYTDIFNKKGYELLIYLISPPYEQISYKLWNKDLQTGDSILVQEFDPLKNVFEKMNLPLLDSNHKYFFSVRLKSPTQGKYIEILNEKEKELRVPKEGDLNYLAFQGGIISNK